MRGMTSNIIERIHCKRYFVNQSDKLQLFVSSIRELRDKAVHALCYT